MAVARPARDPRYAKNKGRSSWIGWPQMNRLQRVGREIYRATGSMPYLVGSATWKRDFRDVDVRVILDDDVFEAIFPMPGGHKALRHQALWAFLCEVISEWATQQIGHPVDFQFQKRTEANSDDPNHTGGTPTVRIPLGIGFYDRDTDGHTVLR